MGAINLDTCDAVEHRIFSVDLDEEEEDGCGRCAKPRSLRAGSALVRQCLERQVEAVAKPTRRFRVTRTGGSRERAGREAPGPPTADAADGGRV